MWSWKNYKSKWGFQSFIKSNKTVIVDAGRSLGIIGGGYINIVSNSEVEGYNISGGFCSEENREKVYFAARFNKPFEKEKIWVNESIYDSKDSEIVNSPIGALLNFELDKDQELLVKVGISYVSIDNARLNLETEIPDWDFDRIKKDAQSKWEKQLKILQLWNKLQQ